MMFMMISPVVIYIECVGKVAPKKVKSMAFYQTNLTEASDIQKNEEIVLMNPYFGVEGGGTIIFYCSKG